MDTSRHCAVMGLGEAGGIYAEALAAAGYHVVGFDPGPVDTPAGVRRAASEADAVAGASFVFVLSAADVARRIAQASWPSLDSEVVYCDLTSSSPGDELSMAEYIESSGAVFTDVAVLGPVSVHGGRTPVLLSGRGAAAASTVFRELGADVEVVNGPPGAAMSHKLLRSVFMKGLASIVGEAVAAGDKAGATAWVRNQIARQLAGDGEAVIDRFLMGTKKHAARRGEEMMAASDYLEELGIAHEMSTATATALARVAAEDRRDDAPLAPAQGVGHGHA